MDARERMSRLREASSACLGCGLAATRKRAVFGEGPERPGCLLVGEAPGATEDETGRPFTGRSGKFLTDLLEEAGLSRGGIFITNVVKCRPPENRPPSREEIEACRPFLEAQMALLRPSLVLTVGTVATREFLQAREGISLLRGRFHSSSWGEQGVMVRPVFHPSYLLRNRSRGEGAPVPLTLEDFRDVGRFLRGAIAGSPHSGRREGDLS